MPEALDSATQAAGEEDLVSMVLVREDLPDELRGFQLAREGVLDNETMAAQGFPGSTTGETRATGRLTGYIREFVSPADVAVLQPGSSVMAATVLHIFQHKDEVSRWMKEKFLGEFQRFAGKDLGKGQELIRAEPVQFDGFSDEAVGLRALQTTPAGLVSSTIVDFRVGRLLGVAYLVALGDVEQRELVTRMGMELERRTVRVLLGAI